MCSMFWRLCKICNAVYQFTDIFCILLFCFTHTHTHTHTHPPTHPPPPPTHTNKQKMQSAWSTALPGCPGTCQSTISFHHLDVNLGTPIPTFINTNKDCNKFSFWPRTVSDCNNLPYNFTTFLFILHFVS